MRRLQGLAIVLVSLSALSVQAAPPPAPLAYLSSMVQDPKQGDKTLAVLRGTEDKALVPVFEAMTRSGDKKRRLFGVVALVELAGKDAATVLIERINTDTAMAVRAESLGRLLEQKVLTPEQIAGAMTIPDENIQCLAARALVAKGKADQALPVLARLAASSDGPTATLAQTCLLGLGHRQYEAPVAKAMRDDATTPLLLGALLRQAERQKPTAVLPLALHVAASPHRPINLRVQAYKVAAEVSSLGAATLRDAIGSSKQDALRVRLLKVLSSRDDAGPHVKKLASEPGAVGALARFELAREAGGPAASAAVTAALAQEHPVVIAYVLDRAGEDLAARGKACDFYTPGLLTLIAGVNPRPRQMQKEHFLAAGAAAKLVELGTPAALAGLKKLLSGKVTAVTRTVAAGLLRSQSAAACELVRPLLSSPYEELSADAALALGHFGDSAARPRLADILVNRQRHAPALAVLASWYLLKIDGKTQPAALHLAKLVK